VKDNNNVQVPIPTWTVKKPAVVDLDLSTSTPHVDNIGSELEAVHTQLVDNIETDKEQINDEVNQSHTFAAPALRQNVSHDSAEDYNS